MRCSMASDVCKLRRDYRHVGLPSSVSLMTMMMIVILGVLLSGDVIVDVTASSSISGANARHGEPAARLREFIAIVSVIIYCTRK